MARRSRRTLGILGVMLAILSAPATAQLSRALPEGPKPTTAIDLLAVRPSLTVTSPAFKNGGDIPFENTEYRGNVFPGLGWTPGPAGTRSYVVIMQDVDLLWAGLPILHWTLFNIPAGTTTLAAGMTTRPTGSGYGPNYKGPAHAYTGPRTPPGPKDRYHFQVFALDTLVPEPMPTFEALTSAMRGHVLASGVLVGLGEKDPTAKD